MDGSNRSGGMSRLVATLMVTVLACGCGDDQNGSEIEESSAAVTWYGDVEAIAQKNCMSCHNDESVTFSMTSYSEELKARAGLMVKEIEAGNMPPWKPAAECATYLGERSLTDEEKAVFRAWMEGGALEGDAPAVAALPVEHIALPWVDRQLTMDAPYLPAPEAGDPNDHRCFVLDPALTTEQTLIGYDVIPGESKVVHHALLYVAEATELEELDEEEPGQGYRCTGGPRAKSAQVIAGWVPGMPAIQYPESTGVVLEPGSKLALQIHYNTLSAGPLPDQSAVALQFAKEEVKYPASIISMSDHGFAIPPVTYDYETSVSITVPGRAAVWAAAPHMHLLGQHTRVEIERENGERSCLIDIPEWDFNWQQFYFLDAAAGMPLNKGDKVVLSCRWDNHTDRVVTWGDGTEDEMCVSYFYVTSQVDTAN